MTNEIPSFFDSKDQQKNKIWNKFCKTQYKNDVIEYESQCCRLSKTNKQLKPFSIQISQEALYAFKNNQPQGMLQLTVTVLLFKRYENKEIFRLKKNGQYVDIFKDNSEQLREALISKCILTTFHNDYKVIKMIGKGSFASVYLAVRNSDGVQYAVKAFNKNHIQGQFRGREGLENEIKIMRRLNQESILHLHEVHETQHSIYFILDLLEGQLMYNLLKGLFYMHSKKCIHRDLKPENLLLKSKDSDTDIVIADLGLAHIMGQQLLYKRCGTPGFVAPEILKYNDQSPFYNEKCDIFSAGIIFYVIVTGKQPFSGCDQKEILKSNKACQINFDIKQLHKSPQNLRRLLKKMVKADPAYRFTAEECLKHQYFQEVFKQDDLTDKSVQSYELEFKTPLLRQSSVQSQEGSMSLMTKQSQWNGETYTVGSLSSCSNNSSANSPNNKSDKQQSNPSKFSQFCTQMKQEGLIFNNPNSQKKKNNQDLHKFALKNSYNKSKLVRMMNMSLKMSNQAQVSNYCNQIHKSQKWALSRRANLWMQIEQQINSQLILYKVSVNLLQFFVKFLVILSITIDNVMHLIQHFYDVISILIKFLQRYYSIQCYQKIKLKISSQFFKLVLFTLFKRSFMNYTFFDILNRYSFTWRDKKASDVHHLCCLDRISLSLGQISIYQK